MNTPPSLETFRALIQSVREGVIVVDRHGDLVFANPYIREILGYEPEEILGQNHRRFIHPGDLPAVLGRFDERMRGGTVDDHIVVRLVSKEGSAVWCDVRVATEREAGSITGAQIFIRDVSARKRAETELLEWKNRHEAAIQSCGCVLFDWDPKTDRIVFGGNLRNILGYDPEDLGPRFGDCIGLIHADDRPAFERAVVQILETREPRSLRYRFRRKDGSYALVEDRRFFFPEEGSPDRESRATRIIGTLADITARRKTEKRLRGSRAQMRNLAIYLARATEKERAWIAREIHDELGDLLSGLKMELALVERRTPEKSGKLRGQAATMIELVDTALGNVRKISTMLRPRILDDLGLIAAIEAETQEFSRRTGVECGFVSRPMEIEVDAERSTTLFRILQEALTNAGRYAHASRVDVQLQVEGARLILEVRDDGEGIPKQKLFDSSSLGLMGMRERALPWGGRVEIESEPGRGTRVTAVLPNDEPEERDH